MALPSRLPDLTQMDFFYGANLKPQFTRRQLILKRILLPVLLRPQQPSGSNLAFLNAHVCLCCVIGCYNEWEQLFDLKVQNYFLKCRNTYRVIQEESALLWEMIV